MKKFPVILDLETKYTFRDFNQPNKLGVSVVSIYDYQRNNFFSFLERDIDKIFSFLENASYIIGFNIKEFDLKVLQGYYPGKVDNFSVFDLLEDIKKIVGKRLSLNDLLIATLNKKKSGHGLQAIEYFKKREWEKLIQYCQDDVKLTKELFEYGAKNKEVYYLNEKGKVRIKVDWEKYLLADNNQDLPLTLPF